MSDDELAEWMWHKEVKTWAGQAQTEEAWLDWLRQEAKE